ncbi:MAG: chorismate synthase [Clostridiales bacterium]|nr:chorismate synthase [Clostridiales bacterium]
MNTFGTTFCVTIFGESHGSAVGVVVDGVPAGLRLDRALIDRELARRAPGRSEYATPRTEPDIPEILSGVKDGVATGAPIACIFRNTDTRSQDYPSALRPGHADWTSLLKYGVHADLRGGGRFSGRLTTGLVFAGAIAKQILLQDDVEIFARIQAIGGVSDTIKLTGLTETQAVWAEQALREIAQKDFPCADDMEAVFKETILLAKEEQDSVGGVIEAACFGVPAGTGEPFFDSVESRVAHLLFSVPAVKGVEFGAGFRFAELLGSEANDPLELEDGKIVSRTNKNGGILGGIASGAPILVRAAIKPTASIGLPQHTVDMETLSETILELSGRHDPCIVPRAVPVVEACLAIALLDLMREGEQI